MKLDLKLAPQQRTSFDVRQICVALKEEVVNLRAQAGRQQDAADPRRDQIITAHIRGKIQMCDLIIDNLEIQSYPDGAP